MTLLIIRKIFRSFLFLILGLNSTFIYSQVEEKGLWYHKSIEFDSVPGIGTEQLYSEFGDRNPVSKIIVAVLDAGVDINHIDLKGQIWRNPGEIENNGIDDDKNGYVDDINGWNFLGNRDGRNQEYDTWEIIRLYNKLKCKYDSSKSIVNDKEYEYFIGLKREIDSLTLSTKSELERWKPAKEKMDEYFEILHTYIGGDEISLEVLRSIDINPDDSSAIIARKRLVSWYESGYSRQLVNLKYHSLEIRLLYKLNTEYNSRELIGDNPDNLTESYYGNPDVIGPDPFHGTGVAGVIGAIRNNDMGMDGIATQVEIMPIRVIPAGDERDKDVANAIYYAVNNGAKILNMSFGKPISPNEEHVEKAIKYAERNDVLIVTGSGNNGQNADIKPWLPDKYYMDGGECATWINVGSSSNRLDSLFIPMFSNYGIKSVDLLAPGSDILSLFPNDQYIVSEGTSISAPMVSGAAALIWSYHPELSALEIKNCILNSVEEYENLKVILPGTTNDKVKFSSLSKTGGTLNVYKALLIAQQICKIKH